MVPYAVSAAAIVVVDTECGVAQGHVAEALVDQKAMKNFCKNLLLPLPPPSFTNLKKYSDGDNVNHPPPHPPGYLNGMKASKKSMSKQAGRQNFERGGALRIFTRFFQIPTPVAASVSKEDRREWNGIKVAKCDRSTKRFPGSEGRGR